MRPSSHSGNGAYCAGFAGSRSQRVTSSENAASCSSVSRICSRLVRAGNRTAVLMVSGRYGTGVHKSTASRGASLAGRPARAVAATTCAGEAELGTRGDTRGYKEGAGRAGRRESLLGREEVERDAAQDPPGHQERRRLEGEAVELVELLRDHERDRHRRERDCGPGVEAAAEDRAQLLHGGELY